MRQPRPPLWMVLIERLIWWAMFFTTAVAAAALLRDYVLVAIHDYLIWAWGMK